VQVGSGVDEVHDVGGEVLSLPLDLSKHLIELFLDNLGVSGSTTVKSDEGSLGFLVSAHLGEPSWGEGEQEHSAIPVSMFSNVTGWSQAGRLTKGGRQREQSG
jgi:hypothetical protein